MLGRSVPAVTVRWGLRLEYDGAAFVGWQVQPNGRSVQGVVQAALEALVQHPVQVAVAGRTDAGVHALGQVAAFSTTAARTARAIQGGLNAHLPEDVACVEAWEVPTDFDPRRWSHGKHYRYHYLDRPARSPLMGPRSWHVRVPMDLEAMNEAAAYLVGTHDLASFRAAGCSAATTVRTVDAATVSREGPLVHFDIHGHGFLRHTVRIMAGCLWEVGQGRQQPHWMAEVLGAADRSVAARTAPAHGLTMIRVRLGDGPRDYRAA